MTPTTKKGPAVLEHHEADAHLNSAEDHMNISTVTEGTDIDMRLPGFHQHQWIDKTATHYVLMLHEEPLNDCWTPRIEASPSTNWNHLGQEANDARAVAGFKWGQDPDNPNEEPWAYVFTSLGLFEFLGYEINTDPTLSSHEAFTGLFRKVEETH